MIFEFVLIKKRLMTYETQARDKDRLCRFRGKKLVKNADETCLKLITKKNFDKLVFLIT